MEDVHIFSEENSTNDKLHSKKVKMDTEVHVFHIGKVKTKNS